MDRVDRVSFTHQKYTNEHTHHKSHRLKTMAVHEMRQLFVRLTGDSEGQLVSGDSSRSFGDSRIYAFRLPRNVVTAWQTFGWEPVRMRLGNRRMCQCMHRLSDTPQITGEVHYSWSFCASCAVVSFCMCILTSFFRAR